MELDCWLMHPEHVVKLTLVSASDWDWDWHGSWAKRILHCDLEMGYGHGMVHHWTNWKPRRTCMVHGKPMHAASLLLQRHDMTSSLS